MNNTLSNENIGRNIKKIREIKNLTQDYLAGQLGISTKSYASWENGTVQLTLEKISNIANVFEMNPIDLLSFDEKVYFERCSNGIFGYINSNNTLNTFSENERKLYETLISSLKQQIEILKNKS